ncbi:hypothetical protein GCM10029964_033070 [Kibdelosporangium lantanae]
MTNPTESQSPADQEITWGGQQPAPRKRWSGKKTAAAVAIAVGVAAAGGVAVYAASDSSTTSTQQPGGFGGPGGGMRGGGPGGPGGLMEALHGTFTVSDGNGGYKTEIMQTGQVTAVTDTSLTAKSTDGYTKVYTLDTTTTFGNGTKTDVKSGDTVTVIATTSGDNATATSVLDRAQMSQGGQLPGGGQPPKGN